MRTLITAYPDVGLTEFEAGLAAALARRGQSVVERLDHPRGDVFPSLSAALARHPGSQALIFFEPPAIGIEAPTSVVHGYGAAPDEWNLDLPRALSQAFGGWASSLLSDRQRDDFGSAVFYAGRGVECVRWSAGAALQRQGVPADAARLDEGGAWARFVAHHRSIGGGFESDLRWSERVDVRSWVVGPPADPPPDLPATSGIRRAMFIDVSAARGREALARLPGATSPLRCLERAAPITGTPTLLVDGDFDDASFAALARQLGAEATAVGLGPDGGRFTWCEVRSGEEVRAGAGQGAAALARVWHALSVMLGEPASIVRWPG